jgi:D-tyrosyl-tRNA(Tyr) deacylase
VRAVVQRVRAARVEVEGRTVGEIGRGFLVLLGVAKGDTAREAEWMAQKLAGLRLFEDAEGKMNLGLEEVGGAILIVSQFTLLGDCRKGRRPSFTEAAPPEEADRLYQLVVGKMKTNGLRVETGVFQAHMQVHLTNDGPVTLLLDTTAGQDAASAGAKHG